jgi:hypothetical protein
MSAARMSVFFLLAAVFCVAVTTCELARDKPDPPELIAWRAEEDALRWELMRAEQEGRAEDAKRLREQLRRAAVEHRRALLGGIPESQWTITPEGWGTPGR